MTTDPVLIPAVQDASGCSCSMVVLGGLALGALAAALAAHAKLNGARR